MSNKKCKDCVYYVKRAGPDWGPLQGLYGCDMLFNCIAKGNKFKSKEEVEAEEEWRRRMYGKAEKHS